MMSVTNQTGYAETELKENTPDFHLLKRSRFLWKEREREMGR